jgi:NMT1-like family
MTELDRPLAPVAEHTQAFFRGRYRVAKRLGMVALVVLVLAILVSRIDFEPNMRRLNAGMLSGARGGNYYALVADLAERAKRSGGSLRNVESAGSGDNLTRLERAAASGSCQLSFALAQDGSDFAAGNQPTKRLELLGRLPKSESVFFLGRDADQRTSLATLKQAKIGLGPEGSGSARLGKQLFALQDLAPLDVRLSFHPLAEDLALAERGELDLVLVVIDEDAPLLLSAVRERNLQIAGLSNLDIVARRIPHLRTGRIGAGQFDALRMLPPEDKQVLRVDTLVLTNGCAGRSATIDLLEVLSDRFPDFLRHNRETPNATGLELAGASKRFFERGGPELVDEFVPWLVDLMPPANWAYIIMAVSVLFNAMGAGHRFRLWRIDDARVKLERELSGLFGAGSTLGDIQRAKVRGMLAEPATRDRMDDLIRRFEQLGGRSRRQSLSMLVPMGQEMAYRYQEGVIYETLAVLRAFRERWQEAQSSG